MGNSCVHSLRKPLSLARLLAREDWATQDMAAKLLTAVIENRLKKSSAFANGMLTGDVVAPSVAVAYGGPDPAEPVSQASLSTSSRPSIQKK